MVWVMLRTSVTLSMTFATRGSRSETWTPGTFDGIGLCGPRTASGASGFMSNMSMCDGPPNWYRKITDFARGRIFGPFTAGCACARSNRGIVSPSNPSPPTRRALRREKVQWLKLEQA